MYEPVISRNMFEQLKRQHGCPCACHGKNHIVSHMVACHDPLLLEPLWWVPLPPLEPPEFSTDALLMRIMRGRFIY